MSKEALEKGICYYEQMKSVAYGYISKRKSSVQEAVYYIMPKLWLRKVFPGVISGSNNLPEKCVNMMLIKKEICKLNINLFIEFVMCPLQNIMIFRQNQK